MSDWKFQDLHLSHQDIYKQYIETFPNNIEDAHKLIIPQNDNEPDYGKYAIHADVLNETIDLANSVQNYWFIDVIQQLYQDRELFNQWVDNLKQTPATWQSGQLYTKNQLVSYNTITYLCINNTIEDTEITNTNYWIPFELQGEKGLNSFGIIWQGAWQANNSYNKNDCVFVDISLQEIELYVANTTITNLSASPVTNNQWTKVLGIKRNCMLYTENIPQSFDYPYDWVYISGATNAAQLYNVMDNEAQPLSVVSDTINTAISTANLMDKKESNISVYNMIQQFYNYYNL